MTPRQPPIAIIGAGPSGLTLARLLELGSIHYVVFERHESAASADHHSSSGTLDIHEDSGQAALKEAGLMEAFQSVARYNVPSKIVDARGNIHARMSGERGDDKPEIDRKDLQGILLRSIPISKVRWGFQVQHVQQDDDGSVSVHCADGRTESGFSLVVGADGAWSAIRRLIMSHEPHYTGLHAFTTFIRPEHPMYAQATALAEKGNYLALGNGQQIFLHYLGDCSYHLSVGVKLPQGWTSASTRLHDPSMLWRSLLRDKLVDWADSLTDLIKRSQGKFRSWPFYTMPKGCLPWKHASGVTLLGDAAHLTVPTGDGVNNALYDSAELARQIIKHGVEKLDAAVLEYEQATMPRAVSAIDKGYWFTERFFGADSPQSFLKAVSGHNESA